MNPLVVFFMVMAAAGVADKFLGGRIGLAASFESGTKMIAELILYVPGIYCIACTVSERYAEYISAATSGWFIDPSLMFGGLLATDFGGYPLSIITASSEAMGRFSGIALSATIGAMISFYLPAYLSAVKGEDADRMILGFTYGVICLPVTLAAGGLLLGMSIPELFRGMVPVLLLCVLLAVGIFRAQKVAIGVLTVFGRIVTLLLFGTSVAVIVGVFVPSIALVDEDFASEAFVMVIKMGFTIAGALITVNLLSKIFARQMNKLSEKLGINEWSIMGMLIGLPGGIAMLPLFARMDKRGQILNGAFAVSGHYILGGQMAYLAANEGINGLLVYFFVKSAGGILAVIVAAFIETRKQKKRILWENDDSESFQDALFRE